MNIILNRVVINTNFFKFICISVPQFYFQSFIYFMRLCYLIGIKWVLYYMFKVGTIKYQGVIVEIIFVNKNDNILKVPKYYCHQIKIKKNETKMLCK